MWKLLNLSFLEYIIFRPEMFYIYNRLSSIMVSSRSFFDMEIFARNDEF